MVLNRYYYLLSSLFILLLLQLFTEYTVYEFALFSDNQHKQGDGSTHLAEWQYDRHRDS